MKNILKKITVIGLCIFLVACDTVDFGDMNENKNGATEAYTAGLLSGAIMTWGTFTNRTGVTIPALLVQYQSQVTYTDEMLYAQTPYGWGTYYQGILYPLTEIININSAAEVPASVLINGSADNQIATAKILRAMAIKRVTDIYGDVPFTNAFKGLEEITPSYDTQESIYKGIISELKEARDLLDGDQDLVKGDLIYNGDVDSWKRLANSVILQAAMQLSKVYPNAGGYAATEFQAALDDDAGVITDISEEAWFTYQDLVGFRSPWFGNRAADYFMSAEFVNALNGCETCPTINGIETENPTSNRAVDDRKLVYVRHDHQTREGVPYGYNDLSGASRAQMSTRYYWRAVASIPIMTASYVYLNRAEAAELGWTTEDAEDMLQSGIEKSFETLLAKAQKENAAAITLDKDGYVTARLAQIGVDAPLLQIIREEKWISLFGQAYDAWAEWRRTGVPDLKPATDSYNGGVIPRRFGYPANEASLNKANYEAAVANLDGGDKNTARFWWDANN